MVIHIVLYFPYRTLIQLTPNGARFITSEVYTSLDVYYLEIRYPNLVSPHTLLAGATLMLGIIYCHTAMRRRAADATWRVVLPARVAVPLALET